MRSHESSRAESASRRFRRVARLAVVGNLTLDEVDGRPERIGGGAYYAARALRTVGGDARIVTKAADADRARLLPQLVATGIPVSCRTARETTTFSIRYHGEERALELRALGDPWTTEEVTTELRGVDAVHLAPLSRADFPAETVAAIARGRRVVFDGQGLVRPARIGPVVLDSDFDRGILRHVSILKLAEDEAAAVLGEVSEDAVRALGVREVVVTLGSRGSLVFAPGCAEHVPAHPLPADPTGAGDAFGVAYLAARTAGIAPVAAARRATAIVATLLRPEAR